MGECKYSYSFNKEINKLESKNNALVTTVNKPKSVPRLSAAEKFFSEHVAIARLLEAYKLILTKDLEDLHKIMLEVSEIDEKIADAIEKINISY